MIQACEYDDGQQQRRNDMMTSASRMMIWLVIFDVTSDQAETGDEHYQATEP
jgi:hypothetical protein